MRASKTKSRKRQAADLTIASNNSCSQLTCTQRGGCSPGREIEFSYVLLLLFMLMLQSQIKHYEFCTSSLVNTLPLDWEEFAKFVFCKSLCNCNLVAKGNGFCCFGFFPSALSAPDLWKKAIRAHLQRWDEQCVCEHCITARGSFTQWEQVS